MEIVITKINKHSAALTIAIAMTILSAAVAILGIIAALIGKPLNISMDLFFSVSSTSGTSSILIFVLMPFLYFVITYISVFTFSAFINVACGFTGGIRFN